MGSANSREEEQPTTTILTASEIEDSQSSIWVVIDSKDDGIGTELASEQPTTQEHTPSPSPEPEVPPVVPPESSPDRPSLLDISSLPRTSYGGPSLPSIVEHPLELSDQSLESVYDHITQPSLSLRSGSASLSSKLFPGSSLRSQHSLPAEGSLVRPQVLDLPAYSLEEPGRMSPGGFLLDSFSDPSMGGSLVEGILLGAERVLRDDGFLAAVKYIQSFIDQETDQYITRSLLHEACVQNIDVFIFNIALMKVDKSMLSHRNEKLQCRTPLHIACSHLPVLLSEKTQWLHDQQKTKISKLLSLNSDTSLGDEDGNTPLHLATFHNNPECVRLILDHSPGCADLHNSLGNTALHIASRDNLPLVVEAICHYQPNARLLNTTKKQRCPLHQAVSKGHSEVVRLLLNYDPGLVTCADGKGMLPLHLALKRKSPVMVMMLLQQEQCSVSTPDNEGKTPLHHVCEWGDTGMLGELIRRDSSRGFLNAQDNAGDTALHIAHRHGNKDSAKILKTYQASKKIVNQCGETAKPNGQRKKRIKLGSLFKKKDSLIPRLSDDDSLVSSTRGAGN